MMAMSHSVNGGTFLYPNLPESFFVEFDRLFDVRCRARHVPSISQKGVTTVQQATTIDSATPKLLTDFSHLIRTQLTILSVTFCCSCPVVTTARS